MLGNGDNWNEIMQSKVARLVLNGICVVVTGYYAIGGMVELATPPSESTQMLVDQLGTTAYFALTIARIIVCLWVCIAFLRMIARTIRE